MSGRLTRAALAADLAEHAFAAPARASLTPRRIGAEVELIPVESGTGRRCPIETHMPLDLDIHWQWSNPLNIIPALTLLLVIIAAVALIVG